MTVFEKLLIESVPDPESRFFMQQHLGHQLMHDRQDPPISREPLNNREAYTPQTIKDKLAARGINQQAIASVLDCDLSTVHCTIYGKRRNIRIANTIALLVGEPVENLFDFAAVPRRSRKPKPIRPPKPTPEEIERLRIEVRMLIDTTGTRMPRAELARKLEKFTGRPVNLCILSNCLSGYRKTKSALILLQDIKRMICAEDTQNDTQN
jgi:hypothetical protein